ncbi:hypothetical protein VOLCADRAFT_106993 [Volvox carteri f. nagariensis]|uniref:Uncharacterized protein n=1 Tax=Volvox carteri f. nagariensis TaxID=3068 RepID=D8UB86_VOLCA|nr:uncharacterized protein VOLCADRAFT_106993 [Volvox carteri f. nagariensis]EFJ43126.1 hypothetical protein VOLCADRAFT_106993 [Volvox carteri f. nagariensis]|eukprot:XP_002955925.1 hypothetical protein VOLCADRAFT_106993 [Volvox carteri f. nagariensis]
MAAVKTFVCRSLDDESLRNMLGELETPFKGVLDLRFQKLGLDAIDTVVEFLRRNSDAIVCVGQNNFYFPQLCKKLKHDGGLELLENRRLTFGWSEPEMTCDYMFLEAFKNDRTLKLEEALQALSALMVQENEKRLEILKQQEAAAKKRAEEELKYQRRLLAFEGFNKTVNNLIEYCVMDTVDDIMRDVKGYELLSREHNRKIWSNAGEEIAEVDGLLWYEPPATSAGKNVLVIVEGKSNMTDDEFAKVPKTVSRFVEAISQADDVDNITNKAFHIKFRRQCGDLKAFSGVEVYVAVGAPVMRSDIIQAAREKGYLIITRNEGGYSALNGDTWLKG